MSKAEAGLERLLADYAALKAQRAEAQNRLSQLQIDCNRLAAHAGELRATLKTTTADRDAVRHQAAVLDRLVRELHSPDGSRALRVTRPLAHLVRRLRGTRVPNGPFDEIGVAAPTATPANTYPAVPQRSIAKRTVLALYRPLRPVLRPITWRVRSFLTAELRSGITQILGEVTQIRGEVTQIRGEVTQIRGEMKQMIQIQGELRSQITQIHGEMRSEMIQFHCELQNLWQELEVTLLTLALGREAR